MTIYSVHVSRVLCNCSCAHVCVCVCVFACQVVCECRRGVNVPMAFSSQVIKYRLPLVSLIFSLLILLTLYCSLYCFGGSIALRSHARYKFFFASPLIDTI